MLRVRSVLYAAVCVSLWGHDTWSGIVQGASRPASHVHVELVPSVISSQLTTSRAALSIVFGLLQHKIAVEPLLSTIEHY